MRRRFTLLLGLLLALSAFASTTSAAVSTQPRPWGVYTDRDAFYRAVKASPKKASSMSEEAKEQRRKQISQALSNAKTRKELEQVAAQFGLFILAPDGVPNSNDVQILSDPSHILYITAPSMTWDPFIMEYEMAGAMRWRDPAALQADAGCPCMTFPKNVGGRDSISLVFSNWPSLAYITSYYTTGLDWNDNVRWSSSVADYNTSEGSKKAVTVSTQDKWLSDVSTGGFYNWWRVRISFWVKNWDTSVHGLAQTVYAHDWKNTDISGVDFTFNGGSDMKVTSGLVIHFTSSTDRFAVQGPDLSY